MTAANTTSLWGRVADADDRNALGELLERFKLPVLAYVRRHGSEDPSDTVQEFFAYLLEGGVVPRFDPSRGSLKTFILGVLRNFLSDRKRSTRAVKRGGGTRRLSLDAVDPAGPDPNDAYRREWARLVLARAWARIRDREAAEILKAYMANPGVRGAPAYETLAKEYGKSPKELANILHRTRLRLREAVEAEIRDYVCGDAQVEEELQDLWSAFQ